MEQSRTETSAYIVAITRVLFPYIGLYPVLSMENILIMPYPLFFFSFLKKILIYELFICLFVCLIIKLFVQRESGVVMIFNQQVAKVQQKRSSS